MGSGLWLGLGLGLGVGLGVEVGLGLGLLVTCIGERSYVKVTAGTPPCCVVCVAAEVVKWYLHTCNSKLVKLVELRASKLAKGEVRGGGARTCRRGPAREA